MRPSFDPRRLAGGAATLAIALTSTQALAGPVWDVDMTDDAGDSATTAQPITASVLTGITGKVGTGDPLQGTYDAADMFLLTIDRPSRLVFSTAGGDLGGSATFDTQLFLFRKVGGPQNRSARALLGNNDAAPGVLGSKLVQAANDNSGFILLTPGTYYIAISAAGVNPIGDDQSLLWPDLPAGIVGFGNERTHAGWAGTGAGGNYTISINGSVGVPAPGAAAVLGLAALLGGRRRR